MSAQRTVPKGSTRQAWTETSKGIALRKLKVKIAVPAMTLRAAPATADTATFGGAEAKSQFFGGDVFGSGFFD